MNASYLDVMSFHHHAGLICAAQQLFAKARDLFLVVSRSALRVIPVCNGLMAACHHAYDLIVCHSVGLHQTSHPLRDPGDWQNPASASVYFLQHHTACRAASYDIRQAGQGVLGGRLGTRARSRESSGFSNGKLVEGLLASKAHI